MRPGSYCRARSLPGEKELRRRGHRLVASAPTRVGDVRAGDHAAQLPHVVHPTIRPVPHHGLLPKEEPSGVRLAEQPLLVHPLRDRRRDLTVRTGRLHPPAGRSLRSTAHACSANGANCVETAVVWRKSRNSPDAADCVEVAELDAATEVRSA